MSDIVYQLAVKSSSGATSLLLDVGKPKNWTTYATTFKPSAEERKEQQDWVTQQHVKNLITLMNAHSNDVVGPSDDKTEVVESTSLAALLDVSGEDENNKKHEQAIKKFIHNVVKQGQGSKKGLKVKKVVRV